MTDALSIGLDELFSAPLAVVTIAQILCYPCQFDILGNKIILLIDSGIFPGIEASDLLAINCVSDEMSPTIEPRDTCIFDQADTALADGGVFVFETPNGAAMGRIVFPKMTGAIKIMSDNPSHADETVEDPGALKVLGRVINVQNLLM